MCVLLVRMQIDSDASPACEDARRGCRSNGAMMISLLLPGEGEGGIGSISSSKCQFGRVMQYNIAFVHCRGSGLLRR
jgi:hypothetical protein